MATARKRPSKRAKQAPQARDPSRGASRAAGATKSEPVATSPEQALMDGMEKLNRVLSKTIELAEAALQLGVRLVDNMGRDQARARMADFDTTGYYGDPGAAREAPSSAPAPLPSDNRVGNRAPLHAGSDVRIAFSINNESAAKRSIQLKLSPLVGEAGGARLAHGALAVNPVRFNLEPLR